MTVIHSALLYILKRFPVMANDVKRLFFNNPEFRTMCQDYKLCAEALERWEQSSVESAPARTREYMELLEDLEREILESLELFRKKRH